MATLASFADATIIAFKIAETGNFSPLSKNTWDPPILDAYSLTVTSSSNLILPSSIPSIVKRIVIIFVILAMGSFSWGFFSYNIVLESKSISKAEGDSTSKGASCAKALGL